MKVNLEQAKRLLKHGAVVAYPTEAVYGLGCNPFIRSAVEHLCTIKDREDNKGFIVLINNFAQLLPLVALPRGFDLSKILDSWPGPTTWIFPAHESMPKWVTGANKTIAIRMSAHPIASALCENGPIISTSANMTGGAPATNAQDVEAIFGQGLEAILEGPLGDAQKPSTIKNVSDGLVLRA